MTDNISCFDDAVARKRGRPKTNLSRDELKARSAALKAQRKARLIESIPGTLADLPDAFPIPFDALLPVAGIAYSRTHIWTLVRKGRFPSTVRLGDNRVAWLAGDIRRHLAERTGVAVGKAVQS